MLEHLPRPANQFELGNLDELMKTLEEPPKDDGGGEAWRRAGPVQAGPAHHSTCGERW